MQYIFERYSWPQSMGIGASLKLQYPIPTELKTPIPNTHRAQNSNTQYPIPTGRALLFYNFLLFFFFLPSVFYMCLFLTKVIHTLMNTNIGKKKPTDCTANFLMRLEALKYTSTMYHNKQSSKWYIHQLACDHLSYSFFLLISHLHQFI